MAKEIERKYLVTGDSYRSMARKADTIRQCYLSSDPERTVRLRVRDGKGFITVKGLNSGAVRNEWEYEIPASDAEEMAQALAGGWAIDKTRYLVDYGGFVWEVDEFHGRLEGLVVAEIELPSETTQFALPPFAGKDVTGNPAYYNSTLAGLK